MNSIHFSFWGELHYLPVVICIFSHNYPCSVSVYNTIHTIAFVVLLCTLVSTLVVPQVPNQHHHNYHYYRHAVCFSELLFNSDLSSCFVKCLVWVAACLVANCLRCDEDYSVCKPGDCDDRFGSVRGSCLCTYSSTFLLPQKTCLRNTNRLPARKYLSRVTKSL